MSQFFKDISRKYALAFMQDFAREEGIAPDFDYIASQDYDFRSFDKDDLKIIVLLVGHFGVPRKYGKQIYQNIGDAHQKRAELTKLLFWKRQGVDHGR